MNDKTHIYGLTLPALLLRLEALEVARKEDAKRFEFLAGRVDALEATVRKEHAPAIDEHEDRLDEHERKHDLAAALLETRFKQLTEEAGRNHEVLLVVRGQNSEILALLLKDLGQ